MPWCTRPARGHHASPDAVFHLFLEAQFSNDFCTDRKPAYDHSMLLLEDRIGMRTIILNLEYISWKYSLLFKVFHAIVDSFSTARHVTSGASRSACHFRRGSCKMLIVRFITLVELWNILDKTHRLIVDSRQSTTPSRSNECHYELNRRKFFLIRAALWGSPDQLSCPCTDKWLPLLIGPTPHLDKKHNQQNTFKNDILINVHLNFEAGHSCLHPSQSGHNPCADDSLKSWSFIVH